MHPDIHKFWTKKFQTILMRVNCEEEGPAEHDYVHIDGGIVTYLAARFKSHKYFVNQTGQPLQSKFESFHDNDWVYYCEGAWTEEEMLRIIKLKAFI